MCLIFFRPCRSPLVSPYRMPSTIAPFTHETRFFALKPYPNRRTPTHPISSFFLIMHASDPPRPSFFSTLLFYFPSVFYQVPPPTRVETIVLFYPAGVSLLHLFFFGDCTHTHMRTTSLPSLFEISPAAGPCGTPFLAFSRFGPYFLSWVLSVHTFTKLHKLEYSLLRQTRSKRFPFLRNLWFLTPVLHPQAFPPFPT